MEEISQDHFSVSLLMMAYNTGMKEIIECIPNFSVGKDKATIEKLADALKKSRAKLLSVESDISYNRTVITFAGNGEEVKGAAFSVIEKAGELIDMRQHKGQHPRVGATDVCPLVPISASVEDCIQLAHELGKNVGTELGIPVYIYGQAAAIEQRRQLSAIRKGEYEGLEEKMKLPEWTPDYGPKEFNAKSGATLIGVRPVQIAYNINLNIDNVKAANEIAGKVRQSGRIINGQREPGSLKGVRAMGVLLESYGIAQISLNLDDLKTTPLHIAFDEVSKQAEDIGLKVTGSEVCGLIPESSLVAAGRYRTDETELKQLNNGELVQLAIDWLGLNQLYPFIADEKVLEYALAEKDDN